MCALRHSVRRSAVDALYDRNRRIFVTH